MSESTIKSYWRLLVDALIIVLTLIGGYLAVQSGRQRASLSSQVARIEKRIGTLPISDPRLVHIQALETENPLEFKWRVYLPANFKMTQVVHSDSSASTRGRMHLSDPKELIAKVQFRENNGRIECYSDFGPAFSVMEFPQSMHAAVLREKVDQLQIEQLGKNGLVTFEPDEEFTILRITVPIELQESMKSRFDNLQQGSESDETGLGIAKMF
ncbi:MAG: hypothetical protein NTY15_00900 [Planctomycetota bacterium]|nr:hypothetical protein [Planctomycetota bacterium]